MNPFGFWKRVYKPEIYNKDTLWENVHDSRKIAKIIDAWKLNIPLSPLFFVKHGKLPMALVADGKHRFTVASYMGCDEIPFMVKKMKRSWVTNAIPSARKIKLRL